MLPVKHSKRLCEITGPNIVQMRNTAEKSKQSGFYEIMNTCFSDFNLKRNLLTLKRSFRILNLFVIWHLKHLSFKVYLD